MAAELSYKNGAAELIYVGETPWHREGHKFETAPTWGELMAVVDYDLEKRPYFLPVVGENGASTMQPSNDAFYIARVDTGKALGTVGKDYRPIPNREAFEVLRPLIDGGVMTVETSGVLRDGADAWLLGRWDLSKFGPVAQDVFTQTGEEILPFGTVMANHSGRRAVLLGQTPIRIVCANTLGAAEREGAARWSAIHHTDGGKLRLVEEAQRLFAGVVEKYEIIARQYQVLQRTILSETQFEQMILDTVCPDPREESGWNPESIMAESVVKRFQKKRETLQKLWREGKGHSGEPTAWYGYQAVCEALDHNKDLWPTRSGCWRTQQLLTGAYAEMKNGVLDLLVDFSMSV